MCLINTHSRMWFTFAALLLWLDPSECLAAWTIEDTSDASSRLLYATHWRWPPHKRPRRCMWRKNRDPTRIESKKKLVFKKTAPYWKNDMNFDETTKSNKNFMKIEGYWFKVCPVYNTRLFFLLNQKRNCFLSLSWSVTSIKHEDNKRKKLLFLLNTKQVCSVDQP